MTAATGQKILFHEVQRFSQGMITYLMVATAVICFGTVAVLAVAGQIPADEAAIVLVLLVIVFSVVFYLLARAVFEITVSTDAVSLRWPPFRRKPQVITGGMISKAEVRKGPPLQYGFQYLPGYGWVYRLAGKNGVQLQLRSGKKIFIGSQDVFMFRKALEQITDVENKLNG
ncbi:MAG TPA: hypothetical protein VFZ78_10650 [Flavisolibacter sp.]